MTDQQWKYQSARDLGMSSRQRLRSLRRESGLVEHLTQQAWWSVASVYLRWRQHLRVTGAHHLPASPPLALVANHSSHFDALALAAALPRRLRSRAFPIAAGDTFFETPVAARMSAFMLNALPMWRNNCGPHALKELRQRLLEEPCGYILFPEGTRSRNGEIAPFKAGIGMIVARTRAPVCPCHIRGAFEAWPPDCKRPRGGRIAVRIGPPMVFDQVENKRAGWEQIAGDLENAVRRLGESVAPDRGNLQP